MENENIMLQQRSTSSESNSKKIITEKALNEVSTNNQDEYNIFRNEPSSYFEYYGHNDNQIDDPLIYFFAFKESFNCIYTQSLSTNFDTNIVSRNYENQPTPVPLFALPKSFQQHYQSPQYTLSLQQSKQQASDSNQSLISTSGNSTKQFQTDANASQSVIYQKINQPYFNRLYLLTLVNELSNFNSFFTSAETLPKRSRISCDNIFRNETSIYSEHYRHNDNKIDDLSIDFSEFKESSNCIYTQSVSTNFDTNIVSRTYENQLTPVPLFELSKSFQQHHQSPQYTLSLQQSKQQASDNNQSLISTSGNSTKQLPTDANASQSVISQKINQTSFNRLYLLTLVNELSNFHSYFTSAETLSKRSRIPFDNVLETVYSNRDIFTTFTDDSNEVIVELCPKIVLCYEHIGLFGCTKQKCLSLHICNGFINDKCQMINCPFGHTFKTDHNNLILKEYFLYTLPDVKLHNLVRNVFLEKIPEICPDYRKNRCILGGKCTRFHICYSYVWSLGNCFYGTNCLFNHNIKNLNCLSIFRKFGLSSNESFINLLQILKHRCLKDRLNDHLKSKNSLNEQEYKTFQGKTSTTDQFKSADPNEKNSALNNKIEVNFPSTKNNIVYNFHFYGNFDKPKICIENIIKKCRSTECKYVHYDHKSQWQFGMSNFWWYDFHSLHSELLDRYYSNANCEFMILPRLDTMIVSDQQKYLFDLLGTEALIIDFIDTEMIIVCDEVKFSYSIRHLTTESFAVCDDIQSTKFKWYFLGNDGIWISFGNDDSSSNIIEKAYQEQPNGQYNFQTSNSTYLLDFCQMIQTNLVTKSVRKLRRRPAVKRECSLNDIQEINALHNFWENMDDNEEYTKVRIKPEKLEYAFLNTFLDDSSVNIVNLYRIQTPYLLKQFNNKFNEFEKKYNGALPKILFHGFDPKYLDDICRDNLDFRLHGDPREVKLYGDGVYFYESVRDAAKNCDIDFMGNKTILIAKVILKKGTLGSKGMTRPPFGADTTVDNMDKASVYVKYDKHEYYPMYIVTLNVLK